MAGIPMSSVMRSRLAGGVPGRPDAMRGMPGGPGRAAPPFLQARVPAGVTGQRPIISAPAGVSDAVRRPGPAVSPAPRPGGGAPQVATPIRAMMAARPAVGQPAPVQQPAQVLNTGTRMMSVAQRPGGAAPGRAPGGPGGVVGAAPPATPPPPPAQQAQLAQPIQQMSSMVAPPPAVNVAQPPAPAALPQLGGNPLIPQGTQAVPLAGLGGLLERRLASPTRFDLPAVQQAFKFLGGELERKGEEAASRADVEAARRGVFFGTPGLTLREEARRPFQEALGGLGTNLLLEQARTGGQDVSQAIADAMRFGETGLQAEQFAAQLGLRAADLGFQGAPDINQMTGALAGMPLPGGGDPNAIANAFGALGALAGQRQGVTAPVAAASAPAAAASSAADRIGAVPSVAATTPGGFTRTAPVSATPIRPSATSLPAIGKTALNETLIRPITVPSMPVLKRFTGTTPAPSPTARRPARRPKAGPE